MKFKLLARDEFRDSVFKRDKYACVNCSNPSKDAHHIIERRLFSDGGYYLENGASLCSDCHLLAEQTLLSCEEIRRKLKVEHFPIPEHFYSDINYDKWGNIIQPDGTRLKGELFYDLSVQKILGEGGVLDLFKKYVKYQRTYHLPHSNLLKDDRMLEDDSNFAGEEVVVSLKMDGENTTMYNDHIHARSVDSNNHPSRNWVKGLWSKISYLIDENMRVCGENLYAVLSIKYTSLPTYFMVYSIWIDNVCLSWEETLEYAYLLGLEPVPVIYKGIYDLKEITDAFKSYEKENEGYVVRLASEFTYQDFRRSVAKYVKPVFRDMVNSSHGHWVSKKIEQNELEK